MLQYSPTACETLRKYFTNFFHNLMPTTVQKKNKSVFTLIVQNPGHVDWLSILLMSLHFRAALLGHLVDTIQSSADPDVVIAGARVLTENPDVGVSPDFLRAAIVDAVAVGRFDLGQVCRAAEVLIGSGSDGRADSQQGPNSLALLPNRISDQTFTGLFIRSDTWLG